LLRRAVRGRQPLALEHTQVFIPYLNIRVRFQDHLTRARLEPAGVRLLALDDYFPRLLDFALAADLGQTAPPPPAQRSARAVRPGPRPQPTARVPTRSIPPVLSVKSTSSGMTLEEAGPAVRHVAVGQHRRCARGGE
jgi:hypothetical protein